MIVGEESKIVDESPNKDKSLLQTYLDYSSDSRLAKSQMNLISGFKKASTEPSSGKQSRQ